MTRPSLEDRAPDLRRPAPRKRIQAFVGLGLFAAFGLAGCGRSEVWGPTAPSSALRIATVGVDWPQIAGGARIGGTITLAEPAPSGGATIQLRASSPLVEVPASVVIPGGGLAAPFAIATRPVEVPQDVVVTAASGGQSSQSATLGLTAGTFFSFVSEPGSIGDGRSQGFAVQNATFDAALVRRNLVRVRIDFRTGDRPEILNLELSAPLGQAFTPGVYEGAVRSVQREGAQPGLDFSVFGLACGPLVGRFEVTEMDIGGQATGPFFGFADSQSLNRFRAKFEQRCASSSATVRGEFRLLMNPWR